MSYITHSNFSDKKFESICDSYDHWISQDPNSITDSEYKATVIGNQRYYQDKFSEELKKHDTAHQDNISYMSSLKRQYAKERKHKEFLKFLEKHNEKYIPIWNSISRSAIYDLFFHNKVSINNNEMNDPTLLLYFGIYYEKINPVTDLAIKYYKLAIQKDDTMYMAMYRLGKLYKNLNNKELAEKYLVDALMDNNNEKALVCLSHLNLQTNKYDLARYYMNRAIEKNPMNSANLKILEDYVSKQKK